MMEKIIVAMNSKYLIDKLKEKNLKYKEVQYREAILELLEKNKEVNIIIIDENISGEVNFIKLIEKIIKINKKIKIIVFLNKENMQKIKKLKNLGVNKIYINKKININKMLEKLNLKEYVKENKAKIIAIEGSKKSGKTSITNMLINYLKNTNKKVLLINLNKGSEKYYYKIIKTNKKNGINEKENFIVQLKENEIKIYSNIMYINHFQELINKNTINKFDKFLNNYILTYDYIIIDIGNKNIKYVKNLIIKYCDKNIIIMDLKNLVEINKLEEKKNNNDIFIVYNKYNLFSINKEIIKNILGKKTKLIIIPYNKKISRCRYLNINEVTNFRVKKRIKKILND